MQIKTELYHCYVVDDNFRNILFRYYLVETSKLINFKEYYVNVVGYGVSITSEEVVEETGEILYEETVEFVTPYKEKMVKLIDELARNQVSPVHLIDVIGEICDDWSSDFDEDLKQKYIKYAIA